MLWPKKIHTRNLMMKKIPAARRFPPPPYNFSNGPSLKGKRSLCSSPIFLQGTATLLFHRSEMCVLACLVF